METATQLTKQQIAAVVIPGTYMHPETGKVTIRMQDGSTIHRLPADAREMIALGRATLVRPSWIPEEIGDAGPETFLPEPNRAPASKGR